MKNKWLLIPSLLTVAAPFAVITSCSQEFHWKAITQGEAIKVVDKIRQQIRKWRDDGDFMKQVRVSYDSDDHYKDSLGDNTYHTYRHTVEGDLERLYDKVTYNNSTKSDTYSNYENYSIYNPWRKTTGGYNVYEWCSTLDYTYFMRDFSDSVVKLTTFFREDIWNQMKLYKIDTCFNWILNYEKVLEFFKTLSDKYENNPNFYFHYSFESNGDGTFRLLIDSKTEEDPTRLVEQKEYDFYKLNLDARFVGNLPVYWSKKIEYKRTTKTKTSTETSNKTVEVDYHPTINIDNVDVTLFRQQGE